MPPNKESLTGIIKAQETVSRTLGKARRSFTRTGETIEEMQSDAAGLTAATASAEEGTESFGEEVAEIQDNLVQAAELTDYLTRSADEAGDEMTESAGEVQPLVAALSELIVVTQSADNTLDRLDADNMNISGGDLVDARKGMTALVSDAEDLKRSLSDDDIALDADQVVDEINQVTDSVRELSRQGGFSGYQSELDADTSGVEKAAEQTRRTLDSVSERRTVEIEADADVTEAVLAAETIDDIPDSVVTTLETKTDVDKSELDSVLGTTRQLDDTTFSVAVEAETDDGITQSIRKARTLTGEIAAVRSMSDVSELKINPFSQISTEETSAVESIERVFDFAENTQFTRGENIDDFIERLQVSSESSVVLSRRLGELDDDVDGMFESSGNITEFTENLQEGSDDAQEYGKAINGATGAQQRLFRSAYENADSFEEFNTELQQSSALVENYGEEAKEIINRNEGLRSAFKSSSGSLTDYRKRLDEVNDRTLRAKLRSVNLISAFERLSQTGVSLGPFRSSLGTVVTILPALIGMLGSLAGAIGGVAVAGLGLTGVLGGMFAGGILERGEQIANTNEDIESTMEGVQELFSRVGDAIKEALEPIRTSLFEQWSMGILEGVVELVRDFAVFTNRLSETIRDFADSMGAAFGEFEPTFWYELEQTTRDLLPELQSLFTYLLEAMISFIRFSRRMANSMSSDLGAAIDSFFDMAGALSELGMVAFQVVLPMLTALFSIIADVAEILSLLPDGVEKAVVAFVSMIPVTLSLLGVIGLLNAAVGLATTGLTALAGAVGLAGVTLWPVVAVVAALVAALAYLNTKMDLVGGTASFLTGIWNGLIDVVEILVNSLIWMYGALGQVWNWLVEIAKIGFPLSFNDEFIVFIDYLINEGLPAVWDFIKKIAGAVGKLVDAIGGVLGEASDLSAEVAGDIGQEGVDLSKAKAGRGQRQRSQGQGKNQKSGPGGYRDPSGTGPPKGSQEYTYNDNREVTIEGGEDSDARLERIVEDALDKTSENRSAR